MKYSSVIFVSTLFFCSSLGMPTLTDIHSTSVDIDRKAFVGDASYDQKYLVTVSRVDALINDNGDLVAERLKTVELNFDVTDGKQLTCNGVVVDAGVSNVEVGVKVVIAQLEDTSEDIESQFDYGLAKINFDVAVSEVELGGVIVRQLTVSEEILEINGESVEQNDLTQQIIDIFPDGTFQFRGKNQVDGKVGSSSENSAANAKSNCSGIDQCITKFADWIRTLPQPVKLFSLTAFCVLTFLALASSVVVLFRKKWKVAKSSSYTKVVFNSSGPVDEDDEDELLEDEMFEKQKSGFYMLGNGSAISTVDLLRKQ